MYPNSMKHSEVADNCNELMHERDELVKRLGEVSIRLSNDYTEHNAIIIKMIGISRRIDEIA